MAAILPVSEPKIVIGRLAPSPTGLLHLGNAWSFLLCWLIIRSNNGKVLLRIDDLDQARSKRIYIDAILEDLLWLGLNWDNGPDEIIFQSHRFATYQRYFLALESLGVTYPCFCSRRELLASAPHLGEEGNAYSGKCANLTSQERDLLISSGQPYSQRLRFPHTGIAFHDGIYGQQIFSYPGNRGDFPLRRSDGVWSYQLATAIDDSLSGVNLVARGRDLLPSAARQLAILKYLDLPKPQYVHFPLLLDRQKERLAKRHDSLSLRSLRNKGVRAEQIIGFLCSLAGINPSGLSGQPANFISKFQLDLLPVNDIVLKDLPF